jgi:hypothetical protein
MAWMRSMVVAVRMRGHVDDRNRSRSLNVPCGVNAVHSPLQMNVHEHGLRAKGEGVLDRLRANTREGDDLISEAADMTNEWLIVMREISQGSARGGAPDHAVSARLRVSWRVVLLKGWARVNTDGVLTPSRTADVTSPVI